VLGEGDGWRRRGREGDVLDFEPVLREPSDIVVFTESVVIYGYINRRYMGEGRRLIVVMSSW
jgi:hypothetical protein